MMRVTSIGAVGILISLVMVSAVPLVPADHTSLGPAETADMWVNEDGDHMTGALGLGDENITFDNGELSGSLGSEGLWFDGRRVCVANQSQPGCGGEQDDSGSTEHRAINPTAIGPWKDNPDVMCYKRYPTAYLGHADKYGRCQLHFAPVTLPDGATVRRLEVHVFDVDPEEHLEAEFVEHPVGSSAANTLAQDATRDPGTPGETTLVMDGLSYDVDNRNHTLTLRFYVSKMREGCSGTPEVDSCLFIRDALIEYAR